VAFGRLHTAVTSCPPTPKTCMKLAVQQPLGEPRKPANSGELHIAAKPCLSMNQQHTALSAKAVYASSAAASSRPTKSLRMLKSAQF
jgi:hypothetical protein